MEISSKNLWNAYRKTNEWKNVCKSHENLFRLGSDAVLLRAGLLLKQFFDHKSDANKWLIADDDEEIIKDFGDYCASLYLKTNTPPKD